MKVHYKNNRLEKVVIGVNILTSLVVAASFVMLFGFDRPLLPKLFLYSVQVVLLCILIAEKLVRFFNAVSVKEFLRCFWYHIPLLTALGVAIFGAGVWFARDNPAGLRNAAIGIYLVLGVVTKLCRTTVNLAASGKNPTQVLIASFLVLIVCGAGILMLPKASTGQSVAFVDSLFTATSATCVTGLIVKDTGKDFSLMGQVVILSLIQLGGLGIVVFGAVFALLLGQALSLRESAAMQDLLNARTLNRLGNMIAFIFVGTIFIEAVGAVSMFGMWNDAAGFSGNVQQRWFYSVFHSISAFCNAGFSLFGDSFAGYRDSWQVYGVVCPLIILGGLGFGVLYNLFGIANDRVRRFFRIKFNKRYGILVGAPKTMRLQSKIVLSVSVLLIIFGTLAIFLLENFTDGQVDSGIKGALFQSISARTAGFNTVDVSAMSPSSRFVLILLMFVGGSPGSAAGGIKTVTLAVVAMTAVAALRKRSEVEMFNRSVGVVVVGRAITVILLFITVLFTAVLALTITENVNGFDMSEIWFETASALGTVGLTTGITSSLTSTGKLIIIAVMLIGRLGPLTLLATLTFNLKPVRYNYPGEAIIVG